MTGSKGNDGNSIFGRSTGLCQLKPIINSHSLEILSQITFSLLTLPPSDFAKCLFTEEKKKKVFVSFQDWPLHPSEMLHLGGFADKYLTLISPHTYTRLVISIKTG